MFKTWCFTMPYLIWYGRDRLGWNMIKDVAGSLECETPNDMRRSVQLIIERTISNKVQLCLLDIPFNCGVPGGVSYDIMPCSLRNSINSVLKYSSPRSDKRVLILFSVQFSTRALNSLNFSKDSLLFFKRKNAHTLIDHL